jgi:cell division protein FtsB
VARRRPPARSRSSLVLRWIAAGVLAVILLSYIPPLRAYLRARDGLAERRAEVAALERKNQALARDVEYARTAEFVEREARKLGLVRPGEHLFIVTPSRAAGRD